MLIITVSSPDTSNCKQSGTITNLQMCPPARKIIMGNPSA